MGSGIRTAPSWWASTPLYNSASYLSGEIIELAGQIKHGRLALRLCRFRLFAQWLVDIWSVLAASPYMPVIFFFKGHKDFNHFALKKKKGRSPYYLYRERNWKWSSVYSSQKRASRIRYNEKRITLCVLYGWEKKSQRLLVLRVLSIAQHTQQSCSFVSFQSCPQEGNWWEKLIAVSHSLLSEWNPKKRE